jgi:hypothetical protein
VPKTSRNKTRFVALNRPIRLLLHFEHPFGINNIDSWWWRNESPRLITEKSVILLFHSLSPMRDAHSSLVRARLRGRIRNISSHTCSMPSNSTIGALLWMKDATTTACMWMKNRSRQGQRCSRRGTGRR